MAPDDHAPTYSLNTGTRTDIQPEEWQQQIQEQFLDFCGDEINEKNRQKLEYAEEFLQNPEEEYRVWKEEIDPRQPTQEMLEQESDIDSSTLVDATLHDLIDTMQGLVPAKDDPEAYQDSLETYRRAIENLDISAYSVLDTDDEYRITTVTDPETLHNNTVMAETCIGFDVSFDYLMDSEFGDIFEQQVSDDHTYILQVEKNGQQKGYSRNLLMEDGDGNRFLGIDTTEVDRDDYDPHAVQALGLAGIQLGRDLGVDYIGMAAAEGRVKEVNSGYSNTSRSIEYEKIGESLDMVSNLFSFRDRRTFDLLFEDPV